MKTHLSLCIAFASIIPLLASEQVWVNGVSFVSGWTDYEKNIAKDDGDDELCWAAATSNILNYWQSLYITSSNIPTGEAIWERYKEVSKDMVGNVLLATQWWLGGDYAGTTLQNNEEKDKSTYADDRAAYTISGTIAIPTNLDQFGGYYWDVIPDTYKGESYINSKSAHIKDFLFFSDGSKGNDFSTALIEQLTSAPVCLGLSSTGQTKLAHAITLWGLEYTENEDGSTSITSMWITDSDDYTTQLRQIDTNYIEGKDHIYLNDYGNTSSYGDIYLIGGYGINVSESDTWALQRIPEPTTATLSLAAVAALGARRRRK